jgi:hypothetical protein
MRFAIVLILLTQDADSARKIEDRQKELAASLKQSKTAEGLNYLAEQYLLLAGEAGAADLYDAAAKAIDQALRIARGTKNAELVQTAQARSAEVKTRATEYAKAKSAMKTLEEKADDPAANLVVGKYLCFVKGDWKKGLPYLAKGSDEGLRMSARMEALAVSISPDPDPEKKLVLGDEWWPKNRERSLFWYKAAWPKLNPLQKEKVRERFKEVHVRGKAAEREVMPAAWSIDPAGRATADELYASSGKRSLRITGGNQSPGVQQGMGHGGAKECVLTVRVLTEGGAAEIRPIWIQFFAAGVNPATETVGVAGDEPWWHEIRVTVKVPEKTTHGRVVFQPPTGGRLWVDSVSLKTEGNIELVENGDFEK